MKKIFVVLSLTLFVLGCDYQRVDDMEPGTITVKNNSSNFSVTYTIGTTNDSVTAGETKTHNLPLYSYIKSYENKKRVSLKTEYPHENDIVYTFSDLDSFNVVVKNSLGENAGLSADGWMDEIINILPDLPGDADDNNYTEVVYTSSPVFTVTTTSGFPAAAVSSFDEVTGTFFVNLQWSN